MIVQTSTRLIFDVLTLQVRQSTGAEVCWPSQLKIGAKTKKDPFVRLIGTVDEIERAKTYMKATLQVRVCGCSTKTKHTSLYYYIISFVFKQPYRKGFVPLWACSRS
ncbi:unnamed protein product [Nippostrongylus brasiliensis]|uniref:Protein bicaudal C homolog 1 (inferred by orthology to a human protein) n=1 Tax=Nippostrongylus brasiliensis TaxID=27835 RepID=A0A0N4XQZ9_NIPBR|nr:unnamed protein product [Nippostrongylus brasiliensis]